MWVGFLSLKLAKFRNNFGTHADLTTSLWTCGDLRRIRAFMRWFKIACLDWREIVQNIKKIMKESFNGLEKIIVGRNLFWRGQLTWQLTNHLRALTIGHSQLYDFRTTTIQHSDNDRTKIFYWVSTIKHAFFYITFHYATLWLYDTQRFCMMFRYTTFL